MTRLVSQNDTNFVSGNSADNLVRDEERGPPAVRQAKVSFHYHDVFYYILLCLR